MIKVVNALISNIHHDLEKITLNQADFLFKKSFTMFMYSDLLLISS